MEKKILRILLKHYTKISYKGGIAKVIFDDEFENIAAELVKSALTPVSERYLLEVMTQGGNYIQQKVVSADLVDHEFNYLEREYRGYEVTKTSLPNTH